MFPQPFPFEIKIHNGRKTTVSKYEKAYKKPIQKNFTLSTGNHSPEDSLDSANRMLSRSSGSVTSIG